MSAKFEFIDAQKAQYPIIRMCAWLEVSTSGFYEGCGSSGVTVSVPVGGCDLGDGAGVGSAGCGV